VDAKDGYLVEIDAYAYGEEVWFSSNRGTPVTIKHPDEEDITQEQRKFINDYFNQMEAAAFAANYTDPAQGYRKYLDLDSFLKNFIVGEFAGNTDTYWSVYMYKDASDGKLYTGPVWDYDLAFENDYRTYPINNLGDYIYASNGSVASEAIRQMVSRIVKEDPEAKERLVELWKAAINEGNLDDLNNVVEENAELLQQAQELNFKRWKILNQHVHMNFQALGSYEKEVQTVKNYVDGRLKKFDELVRR
jgi:flagellar biosynthesis/type III secretory pathway chaperone